MEKNNFRGKISPLFFMVLIAFLSFFYKSPAVVYQTKKAGVIVTDSISKGGGTETYTFVNSTTATKLILGFHLQPAVIEPEPYFRLVVKPGEKKSLKVPGISGMVDQIKICEFDCTTGGNISVEYINASRLRSGHKD